MPAKMFVSLVSAIKICNANYFAYGTYTASRIIIMTCFLLSSCTSVPRRIVTGFPSPVIREHDENHLWSLYYTWVLVGKSAGIYLNSCSNSRRPGTNHL
jgi:hypothetical protein